MIKFFRSIRQQLLTENKLSKYLLYAIGEIILVVIGIFIALQLNIHKENKAKSDLGYTYLSEMKLEVLEDIYMIDDPIRKLKLNVESLESIYKSKDLTQLPYDSLRMIMVRINVDLATSEITFNKMKNLGLSSLTTNDSLNSQISYYYNSQLNWINRIIIPYAARWNDEYTKYLYFEQQAIDLTSKRSDYSALYHQQSKLDSIDKINLINYINSTQGRNLIVRDLINKKYTLTQYTSIQKNSEALLKSIYNELVEQNLKTEPLPLLPSEIDDKEIEVSKELLTTYTGKYVTNDKDTTSVIIEDNHLYAIEEFSKIKLFPYEEDKFFAKDLFYQIHFNKIKGKVTGFNMDGLEKIDAMKLD